MTYCYFTKTMKQAYEQMKAGHGTIGISKTTLKALERRGLLFDGELLNRCEECGEHKPINEFFPWPNGVGHKKIRETCHACYRPVSLLYVHKWLLYDDWADLEIKTERFVYNAVCMPNYGMIELQVWDNEREVSIHTPYTSSLDLANDFVDIMEKVNQEYKVAWCDDDLRLQIEMMSHGEDEYF